MSFVLGKREAPGGGLKRVIREQQAKLVRECGHARADAAAFVHKARVRCKKIRAALRLARPLIGDKVYRRENHWWRDVAHGLAERRDMTARMEALNKLRPHLVKQAGAASVFRLEAQFAREQASAARASHDGDEISVFCAKVRARPMFKLTNGALKNGDGHGHGHGDVLGEGLARSYRAARRAMAAALADPTPKKMHEWRKQSKYHALQMRLARRVHPELGPLITDTRDLSEMLGDIQDIEVLRRALQPAGDDRLLLALELRRRDLRMAAKSDGERLFELKRGKWAGEALEA